MTEFVDAYSKTTGAKQRVPAKWLERNDAPFNDLVKTPRQKARETNKPAEPETKEAK
jgi:hypothetical protein